MLKLAVLSPEERVYFIEIHSSELLQWLFSLWRICRALRELWIRIYIVYNCSIFHDKVSTRLFREEVAGVKVRAQSLWLNCQFNFNDKCGQGAETVVPASPSLQQLRWPRERPVTLSAPLELLSDQQIRLWLYWEALCSGTSAGRACKRRGTSQWNPAKEKKKATKTTLYAPSLAPSSWKIQLATSWCPAVINSSQATGSFSADLKRALVYVTLKGHAITFKIACQWNLMASLRKFTSNTCPLESVNTFFLQVFVFKGQIKKETF